MEQLWENLSAMARRLPTLGTVLEFLTLHRNEARLVLAALAAVILLAFTARDLRERRRMKGAMTPEEFFELREKAEGDFVGVYILYNATKRLYYVGQAKRVLFRVNQHFTGHGNGDVYADYVYRNRFRIKLVKLTESGYEDLDALERDMIEAYHAFSIGYNKNAGNG